MKLFGILLTIVGAIYALYAFNMDVSVTSPTISGPYGGQQVANLDLMAQRQNHIIFAAVIFLAGVAMTMFGHNQEQQEVQSPLSHHDKKEFTGERSLTEDAYRLWLANAYAVERNDVFQKFTLKGEATFDSLDEALKHAHNLETEKLEDYEKIQEERYSEIVPLDDDGKAKTTAIVCLFVILGIFALLMVQ